MRYLCVHEIKVLNLSSLNSPLPDRYSPLAFLHYPFPPPRCQTPLPRRNSIWWAVFPTHAHEVAMAPCPESLRGPVSVSFDTIFPLESVVPRPVLLSKSAQTTDATALPVEGFFYSWLLSYEIHPDTPDSTPAKSFSVQCIRSMGQVPLGKSMQIFA